MRRKNVQRHLSDKFSDFCESLIDHQEVYWALRDHGLITGGAIASLLLSEKVNDYDIYFDDLEAAIKVAEHFTQSTDAKVWVNAQQKINISTDGNANIVLEPEPEKPYQVVCITPNAVSLTGDIQLIFRFVGSVEEIHRNYDFVHCTCSWRARDDKLILPPEALESLLAKELIYVHSRYPICSLMRIRKFLKRGWHINAGQFLKIAWSINQFDLSDAAVLRDQLVGVDSVYFREVIDRLSSTKNVDETLVMTIIDEVF